MKISLLLAILFLSSCSTLNKEDCSKTNWANKGELDGSAGRSRRELVKYVEQCQEHGVAVDKAGYLRGHSEGLQQYCTYKNGLDTGLTGEEALVDCNKIDPAYKQGHIEGYRQFKIVEHRKKLEEEKEKKRVLAVQDIVNRYGGKSCTSDFDCRKDGQCTFQRCQHNGQACTFNNQCQMEGHCREQAEFVHSINEWVRARVCQN